MEKFILFACLLVTVLCKPLSTDDKNKDGFHTIIKINSNRVKASTISGAENVDLIEGDVVKTKKLLSVIDKMKNKDKETSAFDAIQSGAWPNAIVPYIISDTITEEDVSVIKDALYEFMEKTCIKFVERTTEPSYISFIRDVGCYSLIGKQGGKQDISLGQGCGYKGIALHEIMHTLGFFHEQSRRDRDSYIKINYDNIKKDMKYNFDMYRDGDASTLEEPYDKQSIMHYDNYAFSINGSKTVESLSDSKEVLGQRTSLSETDIKQLNKYYNCNSTQTNLKPNPFKKPTPSPTGCADRPVVKDFCLNAKKQGCKPTNFIKENCKKTCNFCL
ncbi:hatching enzyme 1.2 isoform X3 [Hydra vulgaris]|uniref:Metalloendopeptidase n=1 Tax=Hydra vulgaris TaxID=6087 RepID=A0ABM4BKP9_HYDVU